MKASTLHEVWGAPDNTRLTPKQYSFRLPLHVAAKLSALAEIYPQRSRTQIVADLLTSALEDVEKALPEGLGEPVEPELDEAAQADDPRRQRYHYLGGLKGRFHRAANHHYRQLEIEMGGPQTESLYPNFMVTLEDLEDARK